MLYRILEEAVVRKQKGSSKTPPILFRGCKKVDRFMLE